MGKRQWTLCCMAVVAVLWVAFQWLAAIGHAQRVPRKQRKHSMAAVAPSLQPAAVSHVAQVAAVEETAAQQQCVALTWNINMATEPSRLEGIGGVLREQGVALVALNEVSLSPAAFSKQARRWGYPHSLLLRTDRAHRFNMGLLSTLPMKREISVTEAPFFHGVLCARLPALANLLACVVHLTPHSPTTRLSEAQALLRLLRGAFDTAAAAAQGRVLLLGDLNALSAADAPSHRSAGLAQALTAQSTKAAAKFGEGGRLSYEVISTLTSGAEPRLRDLQSEPTATVPTQRGGDPRHAAPMRLDYVLGGGSLVDGCEDAAAWPLMEAAVGLLSDHYPVVARLCGSCSAPTVGAPAAASEGRHAVEAPTTKPLTAFPQRAAETVADDGDRSDPQADGGGARASSTSAGGGSTGGDRCRASVASAAYHAAYHAA